ncbi:MAG: prepilin peptidase [Candidatus Zixiibacteriota bacterium]
MNPEILLSIYAFGMGAFIGSFLNVLIHRLPRKENFVTGRSHCPKCSEMIRWYDNIPLVSFIILRAKCRLCAESISWRYPIVELVTAVFFLTAYKLYGVSFHSLIAAVFFSMLLVVTFIDFEYYIIPDRITYPGMVLGMALSWVNPLVTPLDALIGLLAGGIALYLLAMLGDFVFKKESLGGGDIKLAAMLGAFLGWKNIIFIFFGAAVFGLIYAVMQMAVSRKQGAGRMIPFGPFLSLAALVALFFGEVLIDFYVHDILTLN